MDWSAKESKAIFTLDSLKESTFESDSIHVLGDFSSVDDSSCARMFASNLLSVIRENKNRIRGLFY